MLPGSDKILINDCIKAISESFRKEIAKEETQYTTAEWYTDIYDPQPRRKGKLHKHIKEVISFYNGWLLKNVGERYMEQFIVPTHGKGSTTVGMLTGFRKRINKLIRKGHLLRKDGTVRATLKNNAFPERVDELFHALVEKTNKPYVQFDRTDFIKLAEYHITPAQQLVYERMCMFGGPKIPAYPTREQLMKLTGIKRPATITEAIRQLREAGLLKKVFKSAVEAGGKNRERYLVLKPWRKRKPIK